MKCQCLFEFFIHFLLLKPLARGHVLDNEEVNVAWAMLHRMVLVLASGSFISLVSCSVAALQLPYSHVSPVSSFSS